MTPHGPVHITPDPDGWWVGCLLCQVTVLARTPEEKRVFITVHQVQPDPAWLERQERARAEVAADG